VSNRLRDGRQERSDLLARVRKVSNGVAIHDVYRTNRTEIEAILDGLSDSFRRHEHSETTEVARLLESSSESDDPEVIATLMALEAGRAPTRSHTGVDRHPESVICKKIYHSIDRLHNWNDSHHGRKR
jgi:anthranilate/para-aminobenzoate synthase component II